jgi:hypothetical protein
MLLHRFIGNNLMTAGLLQRDVWAMNRRDDSAEGCLVLEIAASSSAECSAFQQFPGGNRELIGYAHKTIGADQAADA